MADVPMGDTHIARGSGRVRTLGFGTTALAELRGNARSALGGHSARVHPIGRAGYRSVTGGSPPRSCDGRRCYGRNAVGAAWNGVVGGDDPSICWDGVSEGHGLRDPTAFERAVAVGWRVARHPRRHDDRGAVDADVEAIGQLDAVSNCGIARANRQRPTVGGDLQYIWYHSNPRRLNKTASRLGNRLSVDAHAGH